MKEKEISAPVTRSARKTALTLAVLSARIRALRPLEAAGGFGEARSSGAAGSWVRIAADHSAGGGAQESPGRQGAWRVRVPPRPDSSRDPRLPPPRMRRRRIAVWRRTLRADNDPSPA